MPYPRFIGEEKVCDLNGSNGMDEPAYHAWWSLHVRVAKGETLNADELTAYEAGLQQLDAEEAEAFPIDDTINPLRDLRERILIADAQHQRLSEQYKTMCAEMARLEALLDDRTRQALGIGS